MVYPAIPYRRHGTHSYIFADAVQRSLLLVRALRELRIPVGEVHPLAALIDFRANPVRDNRQSAIPGPVRLVGVAVAA